MMLSKLSKLRPKGIKRRFYHILGNSRYQKFIIISRSRTGSNLLISLLNSHPNVMAFGEMFMKLENKNPKDIWNFIFDKYPRRIRSVGFKLFYYHPVDSNNREVWNYVLNDKTIKIIHLTRINMLRTIVSRKISDKVNVWHLTSNDQEIKKEDKKVEISFDECITEFNKIKNWEKEYDVLFKKKHEVLNITYEDLTEDKNRVMENIFDFVNIPQHTTFTDYKKQNPEKLSDLILNYNSLAKKLRSTEYGYLLEDSF